MMRVLNEPGLQARFEEAGYVIIPSLIGADAIAQLLDTFRAFEGEAGEAFHTTHFSQNLGYKTKVQAAIIAAVFPALSVHLAAFKPIFGNFMVKQARGDNFLQMHADWAYVEEPEYRSVSVWIPLVDTSEANGCLGVIPESQKFMNAIRGPGIQQNNFVHDREWVKDYGVLLPVKAGDAIIYDHGLLHFSPPNTTNQVRPAINLSCVPEAAPLIHYCIPEGGQEIEKYSVPDADFFLDYNNFQRPKHGQLLAQLPKSTIVFIDEKMEAYGRAQRKQMSLWNRLKKAFS